MRGWILNIARPHLDQEIESAQTPVFMLDDGVPVFEVWFLHRERWYVMSWKSYAGSGVEAFTPLEVPDALRERLARRA
jgi:hypothetical protein